MMNFSGKSKGEEEEKTHNIKQNKGMPSKSLKTEIHFTFVNDCGFQG